ncbi:MAG: glycerol-3-phosphate 1-O-acyltransferase PlsY [Syntrophomonadaceae bacterium]|jgi:glycerol-3-phosphate acyltransferase PlsY|nr:glycerol-3-phosphate 1-O-acyltransferase PlsY [Syntrophomonadaceae bacterium]MDH7497302.1 glycerol-3-phosphate 1-O-acyltransferase PlsY [Syntrophomonadaceae bacterium]
MSVAVVVVAYLLGAIPFSYLVTRRWARLDIRTAGSGNVGATNVLRTTGPLPALAAALGDVGKGMLAVWLGLAAGGIPLGSACAVAAVIGHCWPVTLGFRGGKGVATSAGVLLMLMPKVFLGLLAIFVLSIALTRIVSVGSLVAAAANPLLILWLYGGGPMLAAGLALSGIVIFKHRSNLRRLRQGIEPRLGQRRPEGVR